MIIEGFLLLLVPALPMLPIFYSDEFLAHDTGQYHPENPGRLTAIVQALKATPWADQLDWRSPTPITSTTTQPRSTTNDSTPDAGDRLMDALHKIHPPRYVEAVKRLAEAGGGYVDPDTVVSPRTYDVALLAVNAWLDGVDYAIATHQPAFVLARPPGHHALSAQGMGFCIFSNAAIAAYYALKQPQIERVAILDWDVHHGNGTQAIVETNSQIAYCSLHEFPHYPGTGADHETGYYNNVLNCPMFAGNSIADYERKFTQQVVPFLNAFNPDLLIVSAGYDANKDDPLANIALNPEDYGLFTEQCLQITRRIVFGLEGGYDYTSLSRSIVATIEKCL